MTKRITNPDFVFEVSWEVCNKVGGIYTVLSTHANTLKEKFGDRLVFIGPDIWKEENNPVFIEDVMLYPKWKSVAIAAGIPIRIGRWNVLGSPIAVLVDFSAHESEKNSIYKWAWDNYGVDSLRAYGDYDEASMFSFAAGKLVSCLVWECLPEGSDVVYQAHEWMSGLGMLWVKKTTPQVATVFTTHATSIGRSIAGNDKPLYDYFEGYNGDQMASELSMEAKHSIEKQSAHAADCFTTVSRFTARECKQLLDIEPAKVLPNGFDIGFVPKGKDFTALRKKGRSLLLEVANQLMGTQLSDETLIISTSGRNDFRCKGFDVYLEALKRLDGSIDQDVLALIEVPCWCVGPREDLKERLQTHTKSTEALPLSMLTHNLHNPDEDRLVNLIRQLGLNNTAANRVKVMLIPCYLDGADGIFNTPYYDLLIANDLCIYPSYYEPWGYTPLESCAFKIPCITTNLSGFGQWVDELLGRNSELMDGVDVINRTDTNYFEVADRICTDVITFAKASSQEVKAMRTRATAIASKAKWKNFAKYYFEAYDTALNVAKARNSK